MAAAPRPGALVAPRGDWAHLPLHLALRLLDEPCLRLLLHSSPEPAAEVAETAAYLLQQLCRDEAGEFSAAAGDGRLAAAAAVLLGAGAHPVEGLDALRRHGSSPAPPQAELRAALLNGACLLLAVQQDRRAAAAADLAAVQRELSKCACLLQPEGDLAAMQEALARQPSVIQRARAAVAGLAAAVKDAWSAAQLETALQAAMAATDEAALATLLPAYAAASRQEGCGLDEDLLA